jgi:hypothetical protein
MKEREILPNEKRFVDDFDKLQEKFIVYSAIRTPDGTILESKHRHDYQSYVDKNDETYVLDGGAEYIRRSISIIQAEDISLYSDAPHEQIREVVSRGSRGKDGKQPLMYILLKDIDNQYLQAIIDYEEALRPQNKYLSIYKNKQKFRKL